MNDISDLDAAYIAGLFDGEGTLRIFPAHRKKSKKIQIVMQTTTRIGMTDQRIILWLKWCIGTGNIHVRPAKGRNKSVFTIYWSIKPATELMRRILPFLKVKRRHAELLLNWSELQRAYRESSLGTPGVRGRFIPFPQQQSRQEIVTELNDLNKRGSHL